MGSGFMGCGLYVDSQAEACVCVLGDGSVVPPQERLPTTLQEKPSKRKSTRPRRKKRKNKKGKKPSTTTNTKTKRQASKSTRGHKEL